MSISQTFKEFKDVVNKAYVIDDLSIRSRQQNYAYARHTYCGLMRSLTKFSSVRIGKSINRDHATVLSSAKVHKELMKTDEKYRARYRLCEYKIISIYGYEVVDPTDYIRHNLNICTNDQQDHIANLMKEFINDNQRLKEKNYV